MKIEPSTPFSNGMEYEFFCENFCYRCKKGKINPEGFAEYPENGGCPIWDAMENARFDSSLFPCNDVVRIVENGKIQYFNVCNSFETDDADLMNAYNKLFEKRSDNNERQADKA